MLPATMLLSTADRAESAATIFLKVDGVNGESYASVYDDSTGVLTLAQGVETSTPEWKYVPVRRYASYFDGRFLTMADLNDDQQYEVILPAYAANKLLVIWGDQLNQPEIVPESFDVGPGPTAVAVADIAGSAVNELLIATTGTSQVGVRGWNMVTMEAITTTTRYPNGFGLEGLLGFATAGSTASASSPVLAILRQDLNSNGQPTLQLVTHNPTPVYGFANSILSAPLPREMTELTSGHPLGANQAGWFLTWAPGTGSLVMIPQNGGAPESYDLNMPVVLGRLYNGTHSRGANFLFGDGSVRSYNFQPGVGFSLRQQLTPPPGESFFALAGDGDTVVTFSGSGISPYKNFNFQVHVDSGTGFELASEGAWPEAPALNGQATVALYTSDPFGNTPLLVESFAAGDWSSGAQVAGNFVNANVETFGGTTAGLGNSAPQSLQPGVAPGISAGALGNQWERSSSVFYVGSPVANGLAPVGIQPPPGNFPKSIAISFQPGTDVTVHHRVDAGPWQIGNGPFWLASNATVEYYGEHSGGSLSPIHSANYVIEQPIDTDGDGDTVPDAIEALAGGDPTKADTDGDGASDFAELMDGSDLNDPNSVPTSDVLTFDELLAEFNWDDPSSAALPADDQDLFMSDPTQPGVAGLKARKIPGIHKVGDITLKRGVIAQQPWFPAGLKTDGIFGKKTFGPAMSALVGVQFPPLPVIPVDLTAADPVESWRQAAQAELDNFHAAPLQFYVGPSAVMSAVVFEYWFGTRLLALGSISSLQVRPFVADTPRSPNYSGMSRQDIDAIQHPTSALTPGFDIAAVMNLINDTVRTNPSYSPMRDVAEAFYQQAIDAQQAGTPLDAPIGALRALVDGSPVPVGYISPETQADVILFRDQLLALIDPRPQVELAGIYSPKPDGSELLVNLERHDLLFTDGSGWHPAGWEIIPPGATVQVRGFQLPGPPPVGFDGEIEVLDATVTDVPEAGYADLDGNGLPDAWEQIFLGGVGSFLGGDTDGDGFLDPEELGAGSDPTDPLLIPAGFPATPRDMRIEFTPGVGPSLVWDGSTSVDYDVWVTTGFFDWLPLNAPVQPADPQRHLAPIDGTQPQEFYRVQIKFPWMRP